MRSPEFAVRGFSMEESGFQVLTLYGQTRLAVGIELRLLNSVYRTNPYVSKSNAIALSSNSKNTALTRSCSGWGTKASRASTLSNVIKNP